MGSEKLGSESIFFRKIDSDPNFSDPILELLESVKDPEIPVLSIRDLGILRAVERDGERVRVVITPVSYTHLTLPTSDLV